MSTIFVRGEINVKEHRRGNQNGQFVFLFMFFFQFVFFLTFVILYFFNDIDHHKPELSKIYTLPAECDLIKFSCSSLKCKRK